MAITQVTEPVSGFSTFSPRARVTVTSGNSDHNISGDITTVSTDKTYGAPEGTFSVQLVLRQEYMDLLNPNDRIHIELGQQPEQMHTVIVGMISDVEEAFTVTRDGQPIKRVIVTGSDMGKILSQHHCQWYAAPRQDNIGSEASITSLVYGAKLYAGGTPAELAKLILEKELHDRLPWTKNFIYNDLITTPDTWTINNASISMHSTVLDALRYVSNEPYNKLGGDSRDDGKYHVILEKCPFNEISGWLERESIKNISGRYVVASHVSKNDHDRINYLWLKTLVGAFGEPGGSNLLMLKGDAIAFDEASVSEHGFRPWFPETRFSPFGKTEEPQLTDTMTTARLPVKERTQALWNWYRRNHTYFSGTITLAGTPDIRVGDGVLFRGYLYFVERVTHSLSVADVSFLTTLHVTRGVKHA